MIGDNYKVEIYSIMGKQIKIFDINSNYLKVDISELNSGIFYIYVSSNSNNIGYSKILKF
jgi:hypothetical protein